MRNDLAPEGNTSFLEACLAQARASQEWFATRVLPLSLDQLRWRPRCGAWSGRAWSIMECLDHLNHTLGYYLPRVEQAIDRNPDKLWDPARGLVFVESEKRFLEEVEPPIRSASNTYPELLPTPAVHP